MKVRLLAGLATIVSCASYVLSSGLARAQGQPGGPLPPPPPPVQSPPGQPQPAQPPPATTAPSAQPPPPAYDPSLTAGGLAPPPPMQTPGQQQAAPSPTEEQLDKAKQEDAGRGLDWVYVTLDGGFSHVGLSTFEVDEDDLTAGFVATSQSGGYVGAGAGLQLLFLRVGPRARVGFYPEWQLFSIGGEVGITIPIGNLEPHFEAGAGYTALGSISGAVSGANDAISIRGFYARVGGGLDYFVTPVFSVGAAASWELLGLTRPELDPSEIQRINEDPNVRDPKQAEKALAAEGSSYGSALAISAVLGLHF